MRIAAVRHAVPADSFDNAQVVAYYMGRARESQSWREEELREKVAQSVTCHLERTGIRQRRVSRPDEIRGMLADTVARAIEDAELEAGEVDLILHTGVGRGWVEPAMAPWVQAC